MTTSNPKIVALLAYRNEETYLPEFFDHLAPYVEGFICLDDNSNDSSRMIVGRRSKLMRLVRMYHRHDPHTMECENRLTLLNLAYSLGADWVLCLDADERLEKDFLKAMPDLIAKHPGHVMWVRVRDLWNSSSQYRTDGVWATKTKPVLMPSIYVENYPLTGLHTRWTPPVLDASPHQLPLEFNLYHLRSIHAKDRAARVAKFKQIDPEGNNSGYGYDYLNDEKDLTLEAIFPTRLW